MLGLLNNNYPLKWYLGALESFGKNWATIMLYWVQHVESVHPSKEAMSSKVLQVHQESAIIFPAMILGENVIYSTI